MELSIDVQREGDDALVRVAGELDISTSPDLQDAHYPGARKLGRGEGYRYPHEEPGAVTDQPLTPESVRGERFYEPTERGFEAELRKRLEHLRGLLGGRGHEDR